MTSNDQDVKAGFDFRTAAQLVLANKGVRLNIEVTSPQNRGGFYIKLGNLSEDHRKLVEAHLLLAGAEGTFRKYSQKFGQDVLAVPVTDKSAEQITAVQETLKHGISSLSP